jgi:hypothetical protein
MRATDRLADVLLRSPWGWRLARLALPLLDWRSAQIEVEDPAADDLEEAVQR